MLSQSVGNHSENACVVSWVPECFSFHQLQNTAKFVAVALYPGRSVGELARNSVDTK